MKSKEIKAFMRERRFRPYKREFKNAVHYFKLLGANLLITAVALVGGWISIIGLWAVFA